MINTADVGLSIASNKSCGESSPKDGPKDGHASEMLTPTETRYDAAALEARWRDAWEREQCFASRADGRNADGLNAGCGRAGNPAAFANTFAIMMPPPNVTGTLHIGHALDNTLPDILVRHARMRGLDALYQPGTDHASIAVHVVLAKQLAKEGKTRFDLGREAFMERAWAWKDESAGTIGNQMRRLGISCDWAQARFTMDPAYSVAVEQVFVTLFERGLVYRGQRLVNWDPVMQTAVSDLEVQHKPVQGSLWQVRYGFADKRADDVADGIEIATTRPETILADGAIAIHPDDPRAKDLVGRKVLVPLVGRAIPIVADPMVDPDFGTGMVKITAAHDFNDFAFYQRHKDTVDIPLINLFTPDAKLNANCPAAYVGMDRFAARAQIVADLDAAGLLMSTTPHPHNVGHAERDDTILEPYLTWQWYVKGKPFAEKCLQALDTGQVTFVNDRDERVMRHWLEHLEDWCISRQLWWGHQIPAWFRDVPGQTEPELYVGHKAPQGEGWRQDEDIFDTWFSSALWPFVTQGWPQKTDRLQAYYPGAAIMSGRDILFFWLVRMLMMGLELTGEVPFKTIYTHGLVLDEHGKKMSKSKGNVIDPLALVDQFGADALRFTMASIASAEDMRLSLAKVEQSRNFCTKLWNAARFIQLQGVNYTQELAVNFTPHDLKHPVNQWLVAELKQQFAVLDDQLQRFDFAQAALGVYHFTWGTFCDWYLELTKPLLSPAAGAEVQEETRACLAWALDKLLKMLHPFMPFITEELWQKHMTVTGAMLTMQRWPKHAEWPDNPTAQAQVGNLVAAVAAVRQVRSQLRISPKVALTLGYRGSEAAIANLLAQGALLQTLGNVTALVPHPAPAGRGEALLLAGEVELILPLEGLVDVAQERARLEKEQAKVAQDLQKLQGLLANAGFVAKAPAEVLAENRARVAELTEQSEKLAGLLEGAYAL